jgi:hypothetical protein
MLTGESAVTSVFGLFGQRGFVMKPSRLLLPAALLMLLLATYWSSRDQVSAQEKPREAALKWEYKVLAPTGGTKDLEKTLNELGADGWEVTGSPGKYMGEARTAKGSFAAEASIIICKRPKR